MLRQRVVAAVVDAARIVHDRFTAYVVALNERGLFPGAANESRAGAAMTSELSRCLDFRALHDREV